MSRTRLSILVLCCVIGACSTPSLHAQTGPPPASGDGPPPATLSAETFQVVVPVTVLGGSADQPPLNKQDFRLLENGREVGQFTLIREESTPITVAFVYDRSSKPVTSRAAWLRGLVQAIVHKMGRGDAFMLASYGKDFKVVLQPTSQRDKILEAIRNLDPSLLEKDPPPWKDWKSSPADRAKGQKGVPINKTAIAIDNSLYELARTPTPKKALVLISDGDENLAKTTFRHVQRYGIPIFSIGFTGIGLGGNTLFRRGEILRRIAKETGGEWIPGDGGSDPAETGEKLVRLLRSQYLITFNPSPGLDKGKTHSIRVEVSRPGVEIRYRRSFRFTKD